MPTAQTKLLDWLLLAASTLLLAVLAGAMLWADAGPGPTVRLHPDHPGMLQATGPASPSFQAWGYATGLAILILMTTCILVGVLKAGAIGRLGVHLAWGCAGLALIFTALAWTYGQASAVGATSLVAGFPPATAWMIYGMWWFPALLLLTMVLAFRRTWLTDDDVERFRDLLRNRQGA